jgi:hypothetical protein
MSTARRFLVPLLAVSAISLAACWDPGLTTHTTRSESNRARGTTAWVIGEDQLEHAGEGTLLSALEARIAQMGVLRGGECPQITLRGRTTVARPTNPGVYVDGARATNTCVLEHLSVAEVERVEVYPMGMARNAGYDVQPGGLILVFMRTSR